LLLTCGGLDEKRNIKILVIVVILVIGGCGYLLCDFHCPRIRPRSGRVIDAGTDEPIEGAVVSYAWNFTGVLAQGEMGARRYETTTDRDGKYFVPACRVIRRHSIFDGGLMRESVLVYKDGYAAYKVSSTYKRPQVGRSFGDVGKEQPYRQQDNLVKLYPWKEGESHEDHYDHLHILGFRHGGELLIREMEKEKERAREEALSKYKEKKFNGRGKK
jgi:hypothetical protein